MAPLGKPKLVEDMTDDELRAHIAELDKQIVAFPTSLNQRLAEEDTGATSDDEASDRERNVQTTGDASFEDTKLHHQKNEAQAELDRRLSQKAA